MMIVWAAGRAVELGAVQVHAELEVVAAERLVPLNYVRLSAHWKRFLAGPTPRGARSTCQIWNAGMKVSGNICSAPWASSCSPGIARGRSGTTPRARRGSREHRVPARDAVGVVVDVAGRGRQGDGARRRRAKPASGGGTKPRARSRLMFSRHKQLVRVVELVVDLDEMLSLAHGVAANGSTPNGGVNHPSSMAGGPTDRSCSPRVRGSTGRRRRRTSALESARPGTSRLDRFSSWRVLPLDVGGVQRVVAQEVEAAAAKLFVPERVMTLATAPEARRTRPDSRPASP